MPELKKLIVFAADVSHMAWHRLGEPAPLPGGASGVDFEWLERAQWSRDPSAAAVPADTAAARYAEGGRCLIGRDSAGVPVYRVWLMPGGTFVPWIGALIRPPAGGMLVSDAWVAPQRRGGNVHRWGAALVVRELVRLGASVVVAGVEEHEFPAMAALYARLGLGICVPRYTLYWLRIGAGPGLHWRWRPPARLCALARDLERACDATGRPGPRARDQAAVSSGAGK